MVTRTTNFEWWDKPNWRELRNKEIAKRFGEGVDLSLLAADYGMTPGTIQFIAYSNHAKRPVAMVQAAHKQSGVARALNKRNSDVAMKERHRLMAEAYTNGKKPSDIAKEFGVSADWVRRVIVDAGAREAANSKSEAARQNFTEARAARKAKLAKDRADCVQMYKDGVRRVEIAAHFGNSKAWVEKSLKGAGVISNHAGARGPKSTHGLSEEQQMELGIRYGCHEPIEDLERDFGVSRATIANITQKWGYRRGSGVGVMERFRQKLTERRKK